MFFAATHAKAFGNHTLCATCIDMLIGAAIELPLLLTHGPERVLCVFILCSAGQDSLPSGPYGRLPAAQEVLTATCCVPLQAGEWLESGT